MTFQNDLADDHSQGQIRVNGSWEQSPFTHTYKWQDQVTVEATNNRIENIQQNNWRFKNWKDGPTSFQRNIIIMEQSTYQADFKKVFNITLRNDFEGGGGGKLIYEGGEVANGYTATDIFDGYKKNFSAITPQTDGGITWNFYAWDDGVTSLARNDVPVTATKEYKARYKGYLVSTTTSATTPSNQRKLTNWNFMMYEPRIEMVYESGGLVWGTYSTDNGANWVNEYSLSTSFPPEGTTFRNPTVLALPDYITIVRAFESVKLEVSTNQYHHEIITDYPASGSNIVAAYSTTQDQPATPVLTSSRYSDGGDEVALFYNDGQGIKWWNYLRAGLYSGQDNGSVIPSTTNSFNHAVASRIALFCEGLCEFCQYCVVWEEEGSPKELKYAQSKLGLSGEIEWDVNTKQLFLGIRLFILFLKVINSIFKYFLWILLL
ncbi:MAG: hypothetical protein HY800_07705 [Ignavibacteriales bacterium]|nr:hypothetical protein [Ignavibacteriales bacterium]